MFSPHRAMKRRITLIWLSLISVFVLIGCATQRYYSAPLGPVTPAPPKETIAIDPESRRMLAVATVETIGQGQSVGRHHDGLLQLPKGPVYLTPGLADGFRSTFPSLIERELISKGHRVATQSIAFGSFQDLTGVEMALAATISGTRIDSYAPLAGDRCTAALFVTWELLDLETRQVVYEKSYRGSGQSSGWGNHSIAATQAFRMSLTHLLQDENFIVATLKSPDPMIDTSGIEWPFSLPPTTEIIRIHSNVSSNELPAHREVNETIRKSTVMIRAGSRSFGSGVIISERGYVLTNQHVIGNSSVVLIELHDGTELRARLVRTNESTDMALLQIEAYEVTAAPLGSDGKIFVGDPIIVVGAPLGKEYSFSMSSGIVSGLRFDQGVTVIQTDAAVNPGNSGGPIIDRTTGQVIGIVTYKLVGNRVEGMGFAVELTDGLRSIGVRIIDD